MSRLYDVLAPGLNAAIVVTLFAVLILLVIGRFRKYWPLLVYVAWELTATLGFTIADLLYKATSHRPKNPTNAQVWYSRLYWTNDIIVDLFRFVLVILLIYMASRGSRRVSGKALAGLVVLMMVLPFLLFGHNFKPVPISATSLGPIQVRAFTLWMPPGPWFNSTSELLNFGAAIMNLMLWATLIASKQRDPQILQVSLGLGIVVTGTAIAYGARHFLGRDEFATIGYLFMNLTQLTGWAIWCRAFWPRVRLRKDENTPVGSPN